MSRRILVLVIIIVIALSLTGCVMEFDNAGGMVSGALKEYKETVDIGDRSQSREPIKLNLDMQAAKAVIEGTPDKLADVKFSYASEELKPEFTVEDDEISIKSNIGRRSFGKYVNTWDVKLTEKLPLKVELKADASDVKLDMSNMFISSVDTILNASTAKIYFDEPNKELLNEFKLNADASSAYIYGAGNIGFDTMDISANASKITIDLAGDNERDGELRIDANASTVKLKLPENVGIRIIIDENEVSSVNIKNSKILSRSKKEYISNNYENAERTLKIYVDLNVTTLTIE